MCVQGWGQSVGRGAALAAEEGQGDGAVAGVAAGALSAPHIKDADAFSCGLLWHDTDASVERCGIYCVKRRT